MGSFGLVPCGARTCRRWPKKVSDLVAVVVLGVVVVVRVVTMLGVVPTCSSSASLFVPPLLAVALTLAFARSFTWCLRLATGLAYALRGAVLSPVPLTAALVTGVRLTAAASVKGGRAGFSFSFAGLALAT